MSKIHAKVIGVGKCMPDKILTNADLEKMVDTSDEWITKRVGIKERRIAEDDVFASDLASGAAEKALEYAGIPADEIDLILVASVSPEMYTPSCSCMVQKNIGASNAACLDVNAACSGFIFAITTAQQYIENGMYRTVLVIGADTLSKITEYKDRSTCVLFGDGAGAVILRATEEDTGLITAVLGSDGSAGDALTVPGLRFDEIDQERRPFGNPHTIWMDGGVVFKFAVKTMASSTLEALEKAGKTIGDVDLIIPHQANQRIIDGAQKRLGLPPEKVFQNIQKYGNISAACVPVAFCQAVEEGRVNRGDLVVLVSMGGGLTWGSMLLEY